MRRIGTLMIVILFLFPTLYHAEHENAVYDLVIIAPQKFHRALEPLVEHKIKHGIRTKLVSIEDVYDQMFWYGRDKAEKLKYFIKFAVEIWGVKYVLLVGGKKGQTPFDDFWIPVRYSHLSRGYDYGTRYIKEGKFLTDLYFADIYDENGNFSSWDDNDNGIFGEWPEDGTALDRPDLHPDVYVGRLPCRNIRDVKIVVRKIIEYESGDWSNSKWFRRFVVVAGDTYPEKTDYYDGEVYTQQGILYMDGFDAVKLWASEGKLSPANVIREINRGCGFIWFSGHGSPALWGTHPPDSEKWIYGLKLWHMFFLHNGNRLPICISGSGCFNNMFNVSILHSEWVYFKGLIPYGIPYCWGWGLVRNPRGGSIATIASTAFSYESPDISRGEGGIEWLDMHFFEKYAAGSETLGEVWAKTIEAFLSNFTIDWNDTSRNGSALIAKNVEEWLLIGDPSLRIGGVS